MTPDLPAAAAAAAAAAEAAVMAAAKAAEAARDGGDPGSSLIASRNVMSGVRGNFSFFEVSARSL